MTEKKSNFLLWLILGGGALLFFTLSLLALAMYLSEEGSAPSISLSSSHVAVLDLEGVIFDSKEFTDQLKEYGNRSAVKAVVLRVNSPGGGVAASQEIYEAVKKVRTEGKKKVVVSMSSVGASGAYYVACAADKIFANPGTITGSIGVIAEWYNYGELMRWAKLKNVVFKSGEFKDAPSPVRDLTEEEKKYLQNLIDDMYSQFLTAVAEGRKLDLETVRKFSDGRVYTGKDAKSKKLVDEIGGLQDAIEIASKLAKIAGEPKLVIPPKERRTLLDLLMGDVSEIIPFNSHIKE